jgi:hypothetical protein
LFVTGECNKTFGSFTAQAGNLNLIDLAQLDDLWFEAMLNEVETIENGIVVLVDMSGCVFVLQRQKLSMFYLNVFHLFLDTRGK